MAPAILDVNTTRWEGLFEEGPRRNGPAILELVNPNIPTFATGSATDEILRVPGDYIPSNFSPPANSFVQIAEGVIEDRPVYPAKVLDYKCLSDHLPVLLPIPGEVTTTKCPAGMTSVSLRHLNTGEFIPDR